MILEETDHSLPQDASGDVAVGPAELLTVWRTCLLSTGTGSGGASGQGSSSWGTPQPDVRKPSKNCQNRVEMVLFMHPLREVIQLNLTVFLTGSQERLILEKVFLELSSIVTVACCAHAARLGTCPRSYWSWSA